ncbi:ABC transporter permease [Bacillus sp. JCM 19041]|uniref:FtsX-like permease family protein n=1 Tax=Bacillus sp. JCM 19041 TaxID=1460637 RepID=UPI0009EB7D4A
MMMTFRQFAFRNSWRNKGTYAAFLFASIVSIFVFFTFAMLLAHPNLEEGYLSRIASLGLRAATIVVFGFSGLFVLYSLGAFLQARKKEFGLLVMHGMRRSQLRKMIFLENLLMGLGALVIGLIIGLCFMKWFLLIGESMFNIEHLQFLLSYLCNRFNNNCLRSFVSCYLIVFHFLHTKK